MTSTDLTELRRLLVLYREDERPVWADKEAARSLIAAVDDLTDPDSMSQLG